MGPRAAWPAELASSVRQTTAVNSQKVWTSASTAMATACVVRVSM
jgi:hypothetical protein